MEGSEWQELYCQYREMSSAAGAKSQVSQKAKALWIKKKSQKNEKLKNKHDFFSREMRIIFLKGTQKKEGLQGYLPDPKK